MSIAEDAKHLKQSRETHICRVQQILDGLVGEDHDAFKAVLNAQYDSGKFKVNRREVLNLLRMNLITVSTEAVSSHRNLTCPCVRKIK